MASKTHAEIETIYFSNGWIEIRNAGDPDGQWIATNSPVEVDR